MAPKPEDLVTQSELTGHWIVEAGPGPLAQGFKHREDAVAEAESRINRWRRGSRRVDDEPRQEN